MMIHDNDNNKIINHHQFLFPNNTSSSSSSSFPTPSIPSFPNISIRTQQLPQTQLAMSSSPSSLRPRQRSNSNYIIHIDPWHTHDDMCPTLHHHHHTLLHAFNPCNTSTSSQSITGGSLNNANHHQNLINNPLLQQQSNLLLSDSLPSWPMNEFSQTRLDDFSSTNCNSSNPLDLSSTYNLLFNNSHNFDLQHSNNTQYTTPLFIPSSMTPISGLAPPSACLATKKCTHSHYDSMFIAPTTYPDPIILSSASNSPTTCHDPNLFSSASNLNCDDDDDEEEIDDIDDCAKYGDKCVHGSNGLSNEYQHKHHETGPIPHTHTSTTTQSKIGQRRKPTIIGIEQKTPGQYIHGQGDNLFIDARRKDGSVTCISLRSAPNRCKADLIEALNWMPEEVLLANWRYFSILVAKIDQSKPFKRLANASLVNTACKLRKLNPLVNVPPPALTCDSSSRFIPLSIPESKPADFAPLKLIGSPILPSSIFNSVPIMHTPLNHTAAPTKTHSLESPLISQMMDMICGQSQTLSDLMSLTQSLSTEVAALRKDLTNVTRYLPPSL